MLGATHITTTLSIVSTPLLFNVQLDSAYVVFIIAATIGSILPDIDEPNSIVGKRFSFISYPIFIFLGHRTITHNLILSICFVAISYIYFSTFLFGLSVGIFLHIIQDSITLQGIKNGIYPFQKINYNYVLLPRRYRFKVGGDIELSIYISSIIYLFFIIIYTVNRYV